MRALAIVPARSGSKGLPGKNLAEAGGRPLLAWTLDAARGARCVERVVVSTDCEYIAATARGEGAEVPFLRPAELALDETPGIAPVVHALRWLEVQEAYLPRWVVLLQPTSPLRTAEDVDAACELALRRRADAVVGVTRARSHPQLALRLRPDARLESFLPGPAGTARRQDLPAAWAPNGAVYVAQREVLLARQCFHGERTYGYPMPPERSVDVDDRFDLELADWLLRRRA